METTADELFSKANEEFVNEDYQKAVDLFTKAIQANGNKGVYYTNRAHAYFKIGEFKKAIADTEKCLSLEPNSEKAILRKGISQFELKNYKEALETFQKGKNLNCKSETFEVWLKSCREKLGLPEEEEEAKESISNSHVDQNCSEQKSKPDGAAAAPPAPTPKKTKHDWYQTQSHVVITVLIKKLKEEDVKADYGDKTLNLVAKLPLSSSEEDYKLMLNLANEIIPDQCQSRVTPSKIEIKLKKRDGIHWSTLEGSPDDNAVVVAPIAMALPTGCQQNTVSKKSQNWDKFVRDVTELEKTEKPEGDAALNHLFQQIYADGSDDVKRAMVKSFYESGGTVLSTNWTEVGEKAVDVKPPSGMEYKQWES